MVETTGIIALPPKDERNSHLFPFLGLLIRFSLRHFSFLDRLIALHLALQLVRHEGCHNQSSLLNHHTKSLQRTEQAKCVNNGHGKILFLPPTEAAENRRTFITKLRGFKCSKNPLRYLQSGPSTSLLANSVSRVNTVALADVARIHGDPGAAACCFFTDSATKP